MFPDALIANSLPHSAFPSCCAFARANDAAVTSPWKAECLTPAQFPRSSFLLRIEASSLPCKQTAIRRAPFRRGSRVLFRECDRAARRRAQPTYQARCPAIRLRKLAGPGSPDESGEDDRSLD